MAPEFVGPQRMGALGRWFCGFLARTYPNRKICLGFAWLACNGIGSLICCVSVPFWRGARIWDCTAFLLWQDTDVGASCNLLLSHRCG